MQHFLISFTYRRKEHSAKVQKINSAPIRFVVYDVYPSIARLPHRLAFASHSENDQLVFESSINDQHKVIRQIGEMIFRICDLQRINVHA